MASSERLRVYPQRRPLRGTVRVPGDKSISHRAVMLAALADGTSRIDDWLPAGDTRATLAILRQLGTTIAVHEESATSWNLTVAGCGLRGLRPAAEPLDARNAGTCMRLLAGILAGQSFESVLDGSEQLRKRPMGRIIKPLRQMGAQINSLDERAPLTIGPAALQGITYRLPVASAQVKSCLLLAGLYADGPTTVIEPGPARDHSERMLQAMGASLTIDDDWVTILPAQRLQPLDLQVPGDISSAAYVLVAALTVPYSRVTVANVGVNPTRTGITEILRQMGAMVAIDNERVSGGEPIADLSASYNEMHATAVGGATVVRAIDEFPILAVALSQAAGRSSVRDAAELRVKEVDRIEMLAAELRKMGLDLDEKSDGFNVDGPRRLRGAEVDSHDDHRLGMTLAVAGLLADSPTTISGARCIGDSFPGFVETMTALGAQFEWLAA